MSSLPGCTNLFSFLDFLFQVQNEHWYLSNRRGMPISLRRICHSLNFQQRVFTGKFDACARPQKTKCQWWVI